MRNVSGFTTSMASLHWSTRVRNSFNSPIVLSPSRFSCPGCTAMATPCGQHRFIVCVDSTSGVVTPDRWKARPQGPVTQPGPNSGEVYQKFDQYASEHNN